VSFALHRPASIPETLALAAQHGAAARFLAGGTDLVIQLHRGRLAPAHVIDLGGLAELSGIAVSPAGIRIGATTTLKAIERHPAFLGGALAEAACQVGGHQVRNIGTIGGNIVNASPAADVVPALLVLEAVLELAGPTGTRRVALAEALRGPGQLDRAPEELLTAILLPLARGASAFLKAGRRRAMEISVVCVAAAVDYGPSGMRRAVRLALGAVGPHAFRVPAAEALLLAGAPMAEVTAAAMAAAQPIDDVRASARFRRHLVGVLVERALAACRARAA
jgi:carbon-monoxide dehydrogenase medium subunit